MRQLHARHSTDNLTDTLIPPKNLAGTVDATSVRKGKRMNNRGWVGWMAMASVLWFTQMANAQLVPAGDVPMTGSFYSMQRTNYPPLPFDKFPDLPVYHLNGNRYLIDDLSVDYEQLRQ